MSAKRLPLCQGPLWRFVTSSKSFKRRAEELYATAKGLRGGLNTACNEDKRDSVISGLSRRSLRNSPFYFPSKGGKIGDQDGLTVLLRFCGHVKG